MKTKTFLLSILFAMSAMALTANCSSKKEHDDDHHENAETQTNTDPTFQKQLASVFTAYVILKDAFVATDATKVKAAAAETQKSIAGVDMKLLKGDAHHNWMNYLGTIQKSLTDIQGSSDIETQRKTFSALSDALYKSVKEFGIGGLKAYYEFCPMALDGGAYWLSSEEKILNPYFGDKMLHCGTVKEKL
jgi:hypothetical protein